MDEHSLSKASDVILSPLAPMDISPLVQIDSTGLLHAPAKRARQRQATAFHLFKAICSFLRQSWEMQLPNGPASFSTLYGEIWTDPAFCQINALTKDIFAEATSRLSGQGHLVQVDGINSSPERPDRSNKGPVNDVHRLADLIKNALLDAGAETSLAEPLVPLPVGDHGAPSFGLFLCQGSAAELRTSGKHSEEAADRSVPVPPPALNASLRATVAGDVSSSSIQAFPPTTVISSVPTIPYGKDSSGSGRSGATAEGLPRPLPRRTGYEYFVVAFQNRSSADFVDRNGTREERQEIRGDCSAPSPAPSSLVFPDYSFATEPGCPACATAECHRLPFPGIFFHSICSLVRHAWNLKMTNPHRAHLSVIYAKIWIAEKGGRIGDLTQKIRASEMAIRKMARQRFFAHGGRRLTENHHESTAHQWNQTSPDVTLVMELIKEALLEHGAIAVTGPQVKRVRAVIPSPEETLSIAAREAFEENPPSNFTLHAVMDSEGQDGRMSARFSERAYFYHDSSSSLNHVESSPASLTPDRAEYANKLDVPSFGTPSASSYDRSNELSAGLSDSRAAEEDGLSDSRAAEEDDRSWRAYYEVSDYTEQAVSSSLSSFGPVSSGTATTRALTWAEASSWPHEFTAPQAYPNFSFASSAPYYSADGGDPEPLMLNVWRPPAYPQTSASQSIWAESHSFETPQELDHARFSTTFGSFPHLEVPIPARENSVASTEASYSGTWDPYGAHPDMGRTAHGDTDTLFHP